METDFFKRQLRVLHLEDNENDHFLVAELFRMNGLDCKFAVAKSQDEFATALKHDGYDLIISDFTLPSYDGLSALSLAQSLEPETPFIFFSGTIGEEVAVDSLKNGATDYVLKQRPNRLVAAVHRALHNAAERARFRRTERALQQSEERFRIVSRATNDVIWEWDLKSSKVSFSENFKTVFGHHLDELETTSARWFDFIHPDDKSRIVSGMSTLLASGGRVWWSEHRFQRANNSYAHIFDRASIIYDSENKPLRMIGVMIDMTERKQAEEKIHEQAALLDKAHDAIIVLDNEACVTYWNKSAERIYNWRAEEAMGRKIVELLFKGVVTAQLEEVVRTVEKGGEWFGEMHEFTKDGKQVIVQSRRNLIRDEEGRPKSQLIINTDITERKQLEEQFLRAQRLDSLGALVSGIAHDLNNALAPILIGTDLLRSESMSQDANNVLNMMEASAKRGTEMVRQVLAFARGGNTPKMVIRTEELVKEIGKIITDTFPKNIHCRIQVGQDSFPVFGFPTQLHQVLMNLCVNARDAMPKGGTLAIITENVRLDAAEAARHPAAKPENYLCVKVTDTGVGIPADQVKKIFQPFFTTKTPDKGTGLGLSTSLNIVKNHGGFMTVNSTVGRGTEFKFYLPAAIVTAAAETVPPKSSLPAGNGERILIVDDEAAILVIMQTALENYGYQVVTAGTGSEAIMRFAESQGKIDLVIADFAMPLMNGPATITALRKIKPGIKTILISGEEPQKSAGDKPPGGSDAFIRKPFTAENLLIAVHEILAPPVKR